MIRIIKHGYSDLRYEITCPICKCHFSFDETDIEEEGPSYDRSVKIYCPDCHYKITDWDIDALIKNHG